MADQKRQQSAEAKGKAAANQAAATPGDQPVPEPEPKAEELTGEDLDKRAAELDIEGRSEMKADEKRKAVAKAERESAAPPEAQEAAEAAEGDTRKFSVARLRVDGPGFLGYPLHEVALGLNDLDDDEELTVADAQARIQEALDRPLED